MDLNFGRVEPVRAAGPQDLLGAVVAVDVPTPHPLKHEVVLERERRRADKGIPRLAAADYETLHSVAASLGVPLVQAPYDAEAQAAHFCQHDVAAADLVATTDYDALVMGAHGILRGLSSQTWTVVRWFDMQDALRVNSREELAAAAVLMGCDYSAGLQGVGPKKALKLARECSGDLARCEADMAALPGWRTAFDELIAPTVDDALRPVWEQPDAAGALELLEELRVAPDGIALRSRLAHMSLLHDGRAAPPPHPPGEQATLGRFAA